VTTRLALLLLLAAPALARGAAAFPLVGPETCKACHPAAYEAWQKGPHARAQDGLPERSRRDRRCLSCHAPLADEGYAGVGCESCHGPGGAYSARYVMRDAELARAVGLAEPGERGCGACHNDSTPSLTRFEYGRKLPLIEHWKAEREEARAAAAETAPAVEGPKSGEPKKGGAKAR
jgi:hypothetical protein